MVSKNPNIHPRAEEFHERYLADPEEFDKLFRKPVKKKMNVLCRVYDIPSVHEAMPDVWRNFTGVTTKIRHFFVHPTPEVFQQKIEDVLTAVETRKYAQATEKIIGHFYNSLKKDSPEWIRKNQLFEFERFKLVETG